MKEILGDIALRLDRQSDILQDLTQQIQRVVSSDNDNDSDTILMTLETIHKNIHSLQVLHRNTTQTCRHFYKHWPARQDPTSSSSSSSSSPSLTPLFCHQVGQACKEIYARHALTIETVAEIVIDVRGMIYILETNQSTTKHPNEPTTSEQQQQGTSMSYMTSIQCIVTRFLQSRLMTQLLCDHVVDCMMMVGESLGGTSGLTRPPKPHGAISVNVNVIDLVRSASIEARHLVETHFVPLADHPQAHAPESPESPDVIIMTKMMVADNDDDDDDDDDDQSSSSTTMTATVVRPWLQYTLVELLKNSLAITMERDRRRDKVSPYFPLVIHVSETETHVQIDLHDQGGGLRFIPRRRNDNDDDDDPDDPKDGTTQEQWFEFATRQDKWDRMDDQQTYAMVSSPIRGLGVGLALSRLHMRQFGGDLMLQDRPATTEWEHGVTATLLLSKNLDTLEAEL